MTEASGKRVVARLLSRGHVARALLRPASEAPWWPDEVEIVRTDLRSAVGDQRHGLVTDAHQQLGFGSSGFDHHHLGLNPLIAQHQIGGPYSVVQGLTLQALSRGWQRP